MSALVLGLAVGAFGALVPSPLAVTLVEGIGRGERGRALARELGPGVLHLSVCVALGLLLGPMLRSAGLGVMLPFVYLAFGLVLLTRELTGEWPGTYMLMGKWILSMALGATFIASDLGSAAGFALGVWLGIIAFHATLAVLAHLSSMSRVILRRSTLLAAAAWVAVGSVLAVH